MNTLLKIFVAILIFGFFFSMEAQNNKMDMQVRLDLKSKSLYIHQQITYYNRSQDTLRTIFLHDWANAYSDKNTKLGKRFVENYSKKFFFSKKGARGFTEINRFNIDDNPLEWERYQDNADILKLTLKTALEPQGSIVFNVSYVVKVPDAKFTGYGIDKKTFNLRYWYITPVVYKDDWQIMHNLDMDDLYQYPTDYTVDLKVPKNYFVASNGAIEKQSEVRYKLAGESLLNLELYLSPKPDFVDFQTDNLVVSTNLNRIDLENDVKRDIINRQLIFLKNKLGVFPHQKMFIGETSYAKNPLYGFNQLPNILRPFSDTFEWDLRMFKILSQNYVDNTIFQHTRKEKWLLDGMKTYMLIQYVTKYYSDTKLIGNIADIWGVRRYHISNLDFNDRYNLTYKYAAIANLDQALSTRSDSLTNFNRKILNTYKAGMGLQYLNDFVGNDIVNNGIKLFFSQKSLKSSKEFDFKNYVESRTDKDVSWFFKDFVHTERKIDYCIKKMARTSDSIFIKVEDKTHLSLPISLYGLKKDSVVFKQWITDVGKEKIIKYAKQDVDNLVLNYKALIPEVNKDNNSLSTRLKFPKKETEVKWLGDVNDPKTYQIFIEPSFNYNLYDGIILKSRFSNKTLIEKDFRYAFVPSYSMRSQSLTGFFKTEYYKYIENEKVNAYRIGIAGNYFHYLPNLAYRKITPYAKLYFKRKNQRSVKSRAAILSYTYVNRDDNPDDNASTENNKYGVLNVGYGYSNPEIINNFSYSTNLEIEKRFGKFSTDIRFRKLTDKKRQLDIRLFTGVFLYNNTHSDFFSYGVNRPSDYLFRYQYYGRSETSGLFSQQFILNDGGFKSEIEQAYANRWITSLNTSVGIWRWFEVYNDIGLAKNNNQSPYFVHDHGVRLNFIHNYLEVYFPVYSNNGWEVTQPHYEDRIRFVFTADFNRIYSFLKRGFM